jgi:hypothetical protein
VATLAHRAIDNTVWRLEAKTPSDLRTTRRKFRYNPRPVKDDPDKASGTIRSFIIRWMGSGQPKTPTDGYDRVSDHIIEIDYSYPADFAYDDLAKLLQQDDHDTVNTLRHPNSWTGWSNANSTDDIGLWHRWHVSTRVTYGPVTHHMVQTWTYMIRETEYDG